SAEQKERFDAIDREDDARAARTIGRATNDPAPSCSTGSRLALTNLPVVRIERAVTPTDTQRAALEDLTHAPFRAADLSKGNCPGGPALTPLSRVEAMEKRLETMMRAVRTVQLALDR